MLLDRSIKYEKEPNTELMLIRLLLSIIFTTSFTGSTILSEQNTMCFTMGDSERGKIWWTNDGTRENIFILWKCTGHVHLSKVGVILYCFRRKLFMFFSRR